MRIRPKLQFSPQGIHALSQPGAFVSQTIFARITHLTQTLIQLEKMSLNPANNARLY